MEGYAAKLPAYRKGEGRSRIGQTPSWQKEKPIEDKGLNNGAYGCPPFDIYERLLA
jgi:hypothetical protein